MARTYFVIKTPAGPVHGFSRKYQCVQVTPISTWVRKFVSYASAQKFIDTYADCGYGLETSTAVILPYSK